MRPLQMLQGYVQRRAEARQRGMSIRGLTDFAIVITGLGALAMVGSAVALGSTSLGLELGSRLAFALCLLLAARPWTTR